MKSHNLPYDSKEYSEVVAIFSPQIEDLEQNILLLQYDKISQVLSFILNKIKSNSAGHISEQLKHCQDTINYFIDELEKNNKYKAATEVYLTQEIERFNKLNTQVEELRSFKNEEQKIIKINEYIDEAQNGALTELRVKAISKWRQKKIQASASHDTIFGNVDNLEVQESEVAEFLSQEIERFRALKKQDYLDALTIYQGNAEEIDKIKELRNQRKQEEREIFKKKLVEYYSKYYKKSTEEYLIVQEGVITNDEAGLFDYAELNTYGYYYFVVEEKVRNIFELARKFYPEYPKKGLEELAGINYTKINFLFDQYVVSLIERKALKLKDIANLNGNDVEVLYTYDYLVQNNISYQMILSYNQDVSSNDQQIVDNAVNKILIQINGLRDLVACQMLGEALLDNNLNLVRALLNTSEANISSHTILLQFKDSINSNYLSSKIVNLLLPLIKNDLSQEDIKKIFSNIAQVNPYDIITISSIFKELQDKIEINTLRNIYSMALHSNNLAKAIFGEISSYKRIWNIFSGTFKGGSFVNIPCTMSLLGVLYFNGCISQTNIRPVCSEALKAVFVGNFLSAAMLTTMICYQNSESLLEGEVKFNIFTSDINAACRATLKSSCNYVQLAMQGVRKFSSYIDR